MGEPSKTRARLALKVGGLSVCALIVLACGVGVFSGFVYRTPTHTFGVVHGELVYIAFHGTPQDVWNYKIFDYPPATTGWQRYKVGFRAKYFFRPPRLRREVNTRSHLLDRLIGEDNKIKDKVVVATYIVPLGLPFLVFAIPTAILYWRDRPKRDGSLCTKCDYNLTGNMSGICPECGTPITE